MSNVIDGEPGAVERPAVGSIDRLRRRPAQGAILLAEALLQHPTGEVGLLGGDDQRRLRRRVLSPVTGTNCSVPAAKCLMALLRHCRPLPTVRQLEDAFHLDGDAIRHRGLEPP